MLYHHYHPDETNVKKFYNPPEPPPAPLTIEQLLTQLLNAVNKTHQAVEPILPVTNGPEIAVHVVEVVTPGTPVSAPEVLIEPGVVVIIRQRHHVVNRTGYVSFEGSAGATNSLNRIELNDNDSIGEKLTSLTDVYFDADTANTFFEIIYRQARPANIGSWGP